mmetsp:Transcript_7358/g.16866  ORF Transcript_7358/g.16866 Transcript_7358/m.16866 type:complete len:294 (-) Transcript_7358:898-1779(-)
MSSTTGSPWPARTLALEGRCRPKGAEAGLSVAAGYTLLWAISGVFIRGEVPSYPLGVKEEDIEDTGAGAPISGGAGVLGVRRDLCLLGLGGTPSTTWRTGPIERSAVRGPLAAASAYCTGFQSRLAPTPSGGAGSLLGLRTISGSSRKLPARLRDGTSTTGQNARSSGPGPFRLASTCSSDRGGGRPALNANLAAPAADFGLILIAPGMWAGIGVVSSDQSRGSIRRVEGGAASTARESEAGWGECEGSDCSSSDSGIASGSARSVPRDSAIGVCWRGSLSGSGGLDGCSVIG